MRSTKSVLLVTALTCLAGGCSGPTDTTPATTCPTNAGVPADVRDIERNGEGLAGTTFGAYPDRKPDWAHAATVLKLLEEVWGRSTTACTDFPKDNVKAIDAAIATLQKSIPAKDQKTSAYAANAVGLAVPEIFAYFHPEIPAEVLRMDAVFRQLGLDGHYGDWAAVAADVESLKADWAASKSAVGDRAPTCHRVGGTATILGDIEQSLANAENAVGQKDATLVETESENGALEVDVLELLFDCPPDGAKPTTGLGAACKADSDCDAGQVCDLANSGGKCAPDPANANPGAPCSTTVDCGSDSRAACATEAGDGFPGGYCAMEPCDDIQVCSPGATCVSRPFETPGCLKSCAADTDCRVAEGYVCQRFVTTPPTGFGPSDHACYFPCKDDAGCTSPLKCDVAKGKCNP